MADHRKHNTRARHRPPHDELLARLPRAFRPRLHPKTVREISLYQNINLDAITHGRADEQTMWDYAANALCWHRVAHAISAGQAEMDAQLQVATRLIERWGRHGRVAFDGPDLQHARDGVVIMDQLAELVDEPTALEASAWALKTMETMRANARSAETA